MKKDTFIFYLEWLRTMEDAQLTNAERSRLIDAIVTYADKNTIPTLPRLLMAIFSPIKATIDRDADKYALKAATNRENGSRGGRPKKPKETQENPVGYFGFSEKTEKTQSHDNVNDNVNDNVFVHDARGDAPGEKEVLSIYEIFFWRNFKDAAGELKRFVDYNEQRKWKALNTPAKRRESAWSWQPQDATPRVKEEFLKMWRAMYMRLLGNERYAQVVADMLDERSKCVFTGTTAKVICRGSVRDYIQKNRPQEILDYIGSFTLTTSSS